jgi:glutamine synthetase
MTALDEHRWRNQLDPGEPQTGSSYDAEERHFLPLPLTLGDALTAFREDKVLRAALPAELVDAYLALKSDEWARFCGAVTDRERDLYTDMLS